MCKKPPSSDPLQPNIITQTQAKPQQQQQQQQQPERKKSVEEPQELKIKRPQNGSSAKLGNISISPNPPT